MRRVTGGCQCGRVRYEVGIADDDAYLCHCRMCQKATGGVAAAFKNVEQGLGGEANARPDALGQAHQIGECHAEQDCEHHGLDPGAAEQFGFYLRQAQRGKRQEGGQQDSGKKASGDRQARPTSSRHPASRSSRSPPRSRGAKPAPRGVMATAASFRSR